jgi:hypothetical protein
MTQYDSPFMGWIVPYPWQEPDYEEDLEEEEQIDDDVDDEGYLITDN